MLLIVFAHRHNKNDVFIAETKVDLEERSGTDNNLHLDFSIMRDVMYQYSKKAQQNFFSHPIESFFLAKFAVSHQGLTFLTHKPDKSLNKEKTKKMFESLRVLKEQAMHTLVNCRPEDKQMCLLLIKDIEQT